MAKNYFFPSGRNATMSNTAQTDKRTIIAVSVTRFLKNPATQPIVQSQHSQENEKTYYLNVAGHNPI